MKNKIEYNLEQNEIKDKFYSQDISSNDIKNLEGVENQELDKISIDEEDIDPEVVVENSNDNSLDKSGNSDLLSESGDEGKFKKRKSND